MLNSKYQTTQESEFAQKCRLALEKSWGTTIPAPKCMSQ
jgi:hypothetical protein